MPDRKRKVIPVRDASRPRPRYDCSKCPGYCCSYSLIEIGKRDIARFARHFGLTDREARRKFTKYDRATKVWVLRHQHDEHFTTICRFFDTEKRRCTVYEVRPKVCRDYPDTARCGYYEFLKFEREQQDDPEFIATT
ncbi:MAG: YkgJ family cysteine cluster protein [Burkholderiales bacterium]